ncbi:MAG TPA: HEAT repeat domain-containing protein, partial [Polyangiaceae bacterium]|nr:HEAT repeat domain-containing protein [Polyangiaceae bacterium]
GDTLFWQGVQLYLETHAHGIVETNDLQRALEKVSGHSLERFFDQWVYRPGHPELQVKISYEDGWCSVALKQTQKVAETALFELELEVEVLSKDHELTRHRKRISSVHDALVFSLPQRPAYVAFDPELRVVGSIQVEAPGDMLRRQLRQGSSARIRAMAADTLAKKSDPTTIAVLRESLADPAEAWMVRAEAARALGKTRASAALDVLIELSSTQHPKVRRAVVQALGLFRNDRALAALRPLSKNDPSYLVEAEVARSMGKTRQKSALAPLLAMLDRSSWGDIVRMGALDGLAALRDEGALTPVLERTRYGHSIRTRRAALGALAELGEGKRVREHLESLLDDGNPLVRAEVASSLLAFGDVRSRGAVRRAAERELDGRVARKLRETLRDLGGPSQDKKRVADELENVRGELAELKARFAKLEAKAEATSKAPRAAATTAPALTERPRRKGRK